MALPPTAEHVFSPSICIDATGLFCPMPIVKLKKAIDKLTPGQRVLIWADDPSFGDDVISWCQETHNKLIYLSQQDGNYFEAVIEKNEEN